jgi:hypothetical protein
MMVLFPRWAAAYRRGRERRLIALRRFAASYGWQVTGVTTDLSASRIPHFTGAHSAQVELGVTGEWENRTALVASVLVQPALVSSARSRRRPKDVAVLLVVLHIGHNDRQFIASRTRNAIDISGISSHVDAVEQPLWVLLDSASRSGLFRDGDTLTAGEMDIVMAHRTRVREATLDVVARLDLLAEVARLLER